MLAKHPLSHLPAKIYDFGEVSPSAKNGVAGSYTDKMVEMIGFEPTT